MGNSRPVHWLKETMGSRILDYGLSGASMIQHVLQGLMSTVELRLSDYQDWYSKFVIFQTVLLRQCSSDSVDF